MGCTEVPSLPPLSPDDVFEERLTVLIFWYAEALLFQHNFVI